ncbi:hypothetical protein DVH02_20900 [Streptomyces corynorhini]|uniref:SH3 domain-containing protein n=1 Tax=Streptomyces corynorhini TaxID=2282652 RepID=A0A370BA11_9ACTN|nr:hypothetical protein DVH02_20900 [Streptomyces corynorhini]
MVGLVVLALAGTGVATAVQPVNLASRADRTAMEPRVDYTGVIKGPDNANVRKGPSLNADKWGLVYDTERVSLRCKATAEGATWYQLAGQRDRWIIGNKLEGIATGIPVC